MTMSFLMDLRMPINQLISLVIKLKLLLIKNEVHLAPSRGEATAVVLFDQSAAFDAIDHGTMVLSCNI